MCRQWAFLLVRWCIFLFCAIVPAPQALYLNYESKRIVSFEVLKKFVLISEEEAGLNEGRVGEVDITVKYNNMNGTLWILGLEMPLAKIREEANKGSCSNLIDKATTFRSHTSLQNASTINPAVGKEYKFTEDFTFRKVNGTYALTYWVILNCYHPLLSMSENFSYTYDAEEGSYFSGPLHYKIEAHFVNAVGGLDREMSYDEIGFPQVLFFSPLHL
jgi:hypothetical protein